MPVSISFDMLIVIFSVVCHLGAALLALRLIKITGKKIAWILVSLSIVVQLVRRVISLYGYLCGSDPILPVYDNEIGLVISVLTLIGVALIQPLFLSIRNSENQMKAVMLRAEEEKTKTEAIVAAIGDGLCIVGANFDIIYQNSIHISYFGDHRGERCYQALQQRSLA